MNDPITKVLLLKRIKHEGNVLTIVCFKCGKIETKKMGCNHCYVVEKNSFVSKISQTGWGIITVEDGKRAVCRDCLLQ